MWHQALFFLMSWFSHQLALLLSFISTCFMLRCYQWSTNIPLFYFQIPLNYSSKGADCICCTFSLHTVPLFVWFYFVSVSIIIAHKTIQFLIFFFRWKIEWKNQTTCCRRNQKMCIHVTQPPQAWQHPPQQGSVSGG